MARLSLNIPIIFKRPESESKRSDQPHVKATLHGMYLVLLSIVCFIFILWILMALIRLFSGFAV